MKLDTFYSELEALAERLGLKIVEDRGSFKGGICRIDGEEMVVLNKSATLNQRTRRLAEVLVVRDLGGIYIKPGVRAALENYNGSQI